MIRSKICIVSVLLSLHAANSYILLTANVEDMHSLAKQIAASPVANQLNKIISRASAIFNQQFNKAAKAQMRSDPNMDEENNKQEPPIEKDKKKSTATTEDDIEIWKPNQKVIAAELNAKASDSSSDESADINDIQLKARRRQSSPDLIELGRNASFYLSSIRKIFENV